jgi:hypothetical protein
MASLNVSQKKPCNCQTVLNLLVMLQIHIIQNIRLQKLTILHDSLPVWKRKV